MGSSKSKGRLCKRRIASRYVLNAVPIAKNCVSVSANRHANMAKQSRLSFVVVHAMNVQNAVKITVENIKINRG